MAKRNGGVVRHNKVMAQRETGALSIDSLEAIYRHSYGRFLRVAQAIVGERETAREVVQEAFAKAIRDRSGFRGSGGPEAWVWAIVVNLARSLVRQRAGRVDLEAERFAASNGQPGECPELRAAVAALPDRQRLAVFLRHYADMDYEQIAGVLDIERGTVAATLHTAHAALRKQLTEVPR